MQSVPCCSVTMNEKAISFRCGWSATPQPGFASPHVKEERSRQAWQKWQMVKSLVSLLPFHPLIVPPLCLSLYHFFFFFSLLCLSLTFSLAPLTAFSLALCFCFFSTCTRVWRSVTWRWTSPSYGTAISSSTIPRRLKVLLPSITASTEECKALNPRGIDGSQRSF